MHDAAIEGFFLGLSLILAIGAQNAFVLRQGLLRRHVFVICCLCALSDAILIAAGVAGFGALIERLPVLPRIMTWLGAAFLLWYGFGRFREALHPQALHAAERAAGSLRAAVTTCLAFTWLNPHVYLDTVVLLGGIASRFAGTARVAFGTGAAAASFLFFFVLGYGARLLAPWFARPNAWRALDVGVGATMWLLAGKLVLG
ncbi:LysE/ArgO family amino acid transporter [Benzoatithermus flavus]|uniref:LysE/ArgO family amino acid transporter n=1 Tax=Benzoatithermus flavus TaxID=3108223 RepID=A0ABU8XR66_9PROT